MLTKTTDFLVDTTGGCQNVLLMLGRFSCYLQSLFWVVTNRAPTIAELGELYYRLLQYKMINEECYVYNPIGVLNTCAQFYSSQEKFTKVEKCYDACRACLHAKGVIGVFTLNGGSHFVVMSNDLKRVLFDPIGTITLDASSSSASNTVKHGVFESLRVID